MTMDLDAIRRRAEELPIGGNRKEVRDDVLALLDALDRANTLWDHETKRADSLKAKLEAAEADVKLGTRAVNSLIDQDIGNGYQPKIYEEIAIDWKDLIKYRFAPFDWNLVEENWKRVVANNNREWLAMSDNEVPEGSTIENLEKKILEKLQGLKRVRLTKWEQQAESEHPNEVRFYGHTESNEIIEVRFPYGWRNGA